MDKEELIYLYWEEECSLKDISEIKGKSVNSIIHHMNKYGIPRRTNISSHHTEHYKKLHSKKGFRFEKGNLFSCKLKNVKYRELVFNLTNRPFCLLCGKTKGRLVIHHLDFNRENNNLKNLVIMCNGCHIKEHSKYKKYGEHFKAI